MSDTFQPGDHVTFEIGDVSAPMLNRQNGFALLGKSQIVAHARPGEATSQKQEMPTHEEIRALLEMNEQGGIVAKGACLKQLCNMALAYLDCIARADLPGEEPTQKLGDAFGFGKPEKS